MGEISVGDKVKFLNVSGGGMVTRIIDARMVNVMTGDGFEIPTLVSELVRIDPTDAAGRFFEEHYRVNVSDTHSGSKDEEESYTGLPDERMTSLPAHMVSGRNTEEIYLAYIPHDQKWLITGHVDVVLVNNTSFDVLYNMFSRTHLGHFEGLDYGSIYPDSRILLATVNREQISKWSDGCLQFLFHRQQGHSVIPPFNSEFVIDGKRFFKEGNYRENPLIGGKGIVVRLFSVTGFLAAQNPLPAEGPTKPENNTFSIIRKHQVAPREAEVDLHIHELMEDPSNLEKSEILAFQKEYFLKCLDSALAENFLRIIFIHGVGNGILKTNLIDLLKKQEGIEYFDAPMAKYGAGAIEVRIPHNR